MSTIGEKIVALRKERGWSSNHLATLAGISSGYLSDIEKGKRKNPSGEIVARIARELGTTVDYLLDHTDDRRPPFKVAEQSPPYGPALTEIMTDLEFKVVPVYGPVAAGEPHFVMEQPGEFIHIPTAFLKSAAFGVRVTGDSMIGIDIRDGDVLLVRPQDTANHGDIVIARVDGDTYTIKRLKINGDCPVLEPENPAYSPIVSEDLHIIGKAVRIVRDL